MTVEDFLHTASCVVATKEVTETRMETQAVTLTPTAKPQTTSKCSLREMDWAARCQSIPMGL